MVNILYYPPLCGKEAGTVRVIRILKEKRRDLRRCKESEEDSERKREEAEG